MSSNLQKESFMHHRAESIAASAHPDGQPRRLAAARVVILLIDGRPRLGARLHGCAVETRVYPRPPRSPGHTTPRRAPPHLLGLTHPRRGSGLSSFRVLGFAPAGAFRTRGANRRQGNPAGALRAALPPVRPSGPRALRRSKPQDRKERSPPC